MQSKQYAIKISNIHKQYRLGQIGGGTLRGDLSSWWAKVRGREDPNTKIGSAQRIRGGTFMALRGIDLTIMPGEAVGIIGRNGAGKSTLLKLLSRVTAPTEGEIDIYGRVSSMLEVGTGFNKEMTGRENIYMNGAILGMTKAEIDAKMEQIIDFSEVREFIDTPVKRYSSGMYVKLAFSVAAHLDSEIMIMDEVLAVGDMAFQMKCLEKMKEAATGESRTVLYVSHNMATIRNLCSRCIVLDQGRVIFDGDVDRAIEMYMGTDNVLRSCMAYGIGDYALRKNNAVLIESIQLDHVDCQYHASESVGLTMKCRSLRPFPRLSFRFQFVAKDATRIGTAIGSAIVSIDRTATVAARIPLKMLTPGQYVIEVALHGGDPYDNSCHINTLKTGIRIEVIHSLESGAPVFWHQNWGYVRLDAADVEVVADER